MLFFGDQIFINIFAALLLLIAIFPSAINFLVTLGRGWWIIEFQLPAHQVFISLCKRTVIKIEKDKSIVLSLLLLNVFK